MQAILHIQPEVPSAQHTADEIIEISQRLKNGFKKRHGRPSSPNRSLPGDLNLDPHCFPKTLVVCLPTFLSKDGRLCPSCWECYVQGNLLSVACGELTHVTDFPRKKVQDKIISFSTFSEVLIQLGLPLLFQGSSASSLWAAESPQIFWPGSAKHLQVGLENQCIYSKLMFYLTVFVQPISLMSQMSRWFWQEKSEQFCRLNVS